jgi:hypothetical protein
LLAFVQVVTLSQKKVDIFVSETLKTPAIVIAEMTLVVVLVLVVLVVVVVVLVLALWLVVLVVVVEVLVMVVSGHAHKHARTHARTAAGRESIQSRALRPKLSTHDDQRHKFSTHDDDGAKVAPTAHLCKLNLTHRRWWGVHISAVHPHTGARTRRVKSIGCFVSHCKKISNARVAGIIR